MKRMAQFPILAVTITALLAGCSEPSINHNDAVPIYNLVILLDGSDRLHKQSDIQILTIDNLTEIALKIREKGKGELYISYIDQNCTNNNVTYLKIPQTPKPTGVKKKRDYETSTEYKIRLNKAKDHLKQDSTEFANRLVIFKYEAQKIINEAYSNRVANEPQGSDINGSLNSSYRLFRSIPNEPNALYFIILVSDGIDNIGRTLLETKESINILLVNNGSNANLSDKVIELANVSKMEDYVFNR